MLDCQKDFIIRNNDEVLLASIDKFIDICSHFMDSTFLDLSIKLRLKINIFEHLQRITKTLLDNNFGAFVVNHLFLTY